jgi:hypothetical protein
VVVASRAVRISSIVRSVQIAVKLAGSVTNDMRQIVASDPHEPVLLVFVLEIGEGHFHAGIQDQIVIAILIASVVDRRGTGAIRGSRLGPRVLVSYSGR